MDGYNLQSRYKSESPDIPPAPSPPVLSSSYDPYKKSRKEASPDRNRRRKRSGSRSPGHSKRSRSIEKGKDRDRDRDRDRSYRKHSKKDRSRSRSRDRRKRSRSRSKSHSSHHSKSSHKHKDKKNREKNSDKDREASSSQTCLVQPNAFKNDGSFMEMFKKMQEQIGPPPSENVSKPLEEKPIIPPPLIVGKRRGGRILKTGMVAKPKTEEVVETPKDAWSLYMAEVKKYREVCCQEEDNTRPLVK